MFLRAFDHTETFDFRGFAGRFWKPAAKPVLVQFESDPAFAGYSLSRQLLLTLIEDFGGEATCFTLAGKLADRHARAGGTDAPSYERVRAELDSLTGDHALTLETIGTSAVIVRIEVAGIERAYDRTPATPVC